MLAKKRDSSQQSLKVTFHTLDKKVMYKYGKSKDWLVGFYEDVIAEELGVGVYAETWGHNKDGLLDPKCNKDKT